MAYQRLAAGAVGPTPGVSVGGIGRAGSAVRWTASALLGGQGHHAAAPALLEGRRERTRRAPAARAGL
jgi:hypothetical protein